jgi:hypothetical protein
VLLVAAALLTGVTGCSGAPARAPSCGATERLALIAQSVPSSSYVPCILDLPAGWSSGPLHARNGHTRFELESDRSRDHPVRIDVRPSCSVGAAAPIQPRTPGGRTYLALRQIDPRYSGTMYDVFPGGCVSYRFDFERGAHIALIAQLQSAVGFVSRQQLRHDLHDRLGVRLDP